MKSKIVVANALYRFYSNLGLLNSIPAIQDRGGELRPIEGAPPDLDRMPVGCSFAPRCRWRVEACWSVLPPLGPVGIVPAHVAACHNPVRDDEVLGAANSRMVQEIVREDAQQSSAPISEQMLMWLSSRVPRHAERVLAAARANYDPAPASVD